MKEEEKCHQQKYKGWNTICLKNTLHKKVPRKKLLWNRNHLLNEMMMMNIESIIIGIDTESQIERFVSYYFIPILSNDRKPTIIKAQVMTS